MDKYFKKIITLYMIALICFSIVIGFSLNYFVSRNLINQNVDHLIQVAQSFEQRYQEINESTIFVNFALQEELSILREYSEASFWLVNNEGYLYIDDSASKKLVNSSIGIEDVRTVFKGNIVTKVGTIKEISDDEMLIVGYPVNYQEHTDYALFLHISMPEVLKLKRSINSIVGIALFIAAFIGVGLVILFSKKMLQELIELNKMVSYISKGNYNKRIDTSKKSNLEELEMNINKMAHQLKKSDENKRRFISNLTHDLRSPLTNIIGYSDGMLNGTIPIHEHNKYLKIVSDEGKRLELLVNDILDLSKLESGEIELNYEQFNISQLVLETAEVYENRMANKNISFDISFDNSYEIAYGDKLQIKRVVDNLMSNAVKFTCKNGSIRIVVKEKVDRFIISVINTYHKINTDELNTIFDRFTKLDKSRGKEKISSGLGLSIVKEILKAHQEKISVTSDETQGIRFEFTIKKYKNS